ncbi:dehydrogenase [Zafaria cholistanensis]|uniref:Dehydrogenase n=1 Tax=Zafaria cholistanensis TaxID=1682741 RepID=A0A5A7NPA2_9MICC|nr:dehydrogenase [Zafaria cholistanensis]
MTFPDAGLLRSCEPLPPGIRAGVWDLEGVPAGVPLDRVEAVVLPYAAGTGRFTAVRRAPNVRLVQTQTTGYDGVSDLVGKDVAVASAQGVHAAATAELAVGLALASLRGIGEAARDQAAGTWAPRRWPGLADRRVGVLGVGGIGGEIRRRLEPFEVDLVRFGTTARTDGCGTVHGIDELEALAPGLEVLICIVPLTAATRGLVGRRVLAALPDGAVVVNVARGPVVDTDALAAEVASGRLRCALDVIDPEPLPAGHPLWRLPGALITPHNGGNTEAFPRRMAALLRRQLDAFAAGREPENLVHRGTRL